MAFDPPFVIMGGAPEKNLSPAPLMAAGASGASNDRPGQNHDPAEHRVLVVLGRLRGKYRPVSLAGNHTDTMRTTMHSRIKDRLAQIACAEGTAPDTRQRALIRLIENSTRRDASMWLRVMDAYRSDLGAA